MKTCIFRARLAVLPLALAAAFPVFAQTQSDSTFKEVVVTATRIDQLLMSAPIGSSVLQGGDIMRSGVTDANEAIRNLAGVFARRDLNGGRESSLDIRGYGDAAASNVVVLIDGIRISENDLESARLSGIPAEMIDRIEVTRGGSAVLWGQGATGGVINVITKAPAGDLGVHGSVSAGVESFGGRDVLASVQSSSKALNFFANARNYHSDGFRKNNSFDGNSVNAGVVFGDVDTLKTKLTASTEKLDMRWAGALPIQEFYLDATKTNSPLDFGNTNTDRFAITVEKNVGSANFAIDLAKRKRNSEGLSFYAPDDISDNKSESATLQLSPRMTIDKVFGNVALNVVTGLDFYRWSYDASRIYISPSWPSKRIEHGDQSSQAAYVRLSALAQSGWRVDTGFRVERFNQLITNKSDETSLDTNPTLHAAELGISYVFTPQWTAYSRAATSYRIANVDELRYLTSVLLMQQTRDIELGIRYRTIESALDIRLFQQSTTDEIAYDNSLMLNINLDPVQRKGIEMDASHRLSSMFKVAATIQVLDAKISSGDYAGNRLPLTAESVATARLIYTPDTQNSVDLALRTVGAMKFGNDWTNTCSDIPSAQFLDVSYRYRSSLSNGWSLRAGVDNLTDKQTFSAGYTNSTCSAYNVYPDVGRKLKLSASYSF